MDPSMGEFMYFSFVYSICVSNVEKQDSLYLKVISSVLIRLTHYSETTTLDLAHSGRLAASSDTLSTNVR